MSDRALLSRHLCSPVVFFNAHPFNTLNHRSGRIFLNNKFSGSFQICGLRLMEKIHMISTDDFDEQSIDILQCFIVRLQGLHQLRRRIEELFGQRHRTNLLKQGAPFCQIRSVVRCSEEQDTIGRDVDRSQPLCMLMISNVIAERQTSLNHQSPERMADEDDGSFHCFFDLLPVSVGPGSCDLSITYRPIGNQSAGQMFCMIVYSVFRRSICKSSDVRIVPVGQYSRSLLFESRGEEIGRPKDIWFLRRPSIVRMSIQSVDKDDVD